ncbi:hypothetical protein M231_07360 [Tremella mesenterica]|uniref:Uncharacterized protein n=1 Tax=Tremella mesenterica TaxID=5217 RepID=A0A4V1M323_TREME|nr:hypothetical protein M231_07360 [Tremella mesenterica]
MADLPSFTTQIITGTVLGTALVAYGWPWLFPTPQTRFNYELMWQTDADHKSKMHLNIRVSHKDPPLEETMVTSKAFLYPNTFVWGEEPTEQSKTSLVSRFNASILDLEASIQRLETTIGKTFEVVSFQIPFLIYMKIDVPNRDDETIQNIRKEMEILGLQKFVTEVAKETENEKSMGGRQLIEDTTAANPTEQ